MVLDRAEEPLDAVARPTEALADDDRGFAIGFGRKCPPRRFGSRPSRAARWIHNPCLPEVKRPLASRRSSQARW